MRIPARDFVDLVPENIGEQVRVNHDDCPAGQDTKRRLYVKRIEGNTAVAYCHNCAGSGMAKLGSRVLSARRHGLLSDDVSGVLHSSATTREGSEGGDEVPTQEVTIPRDASFKINEWPSEARSWLTRYGITDGGRDVFYSEKEGKVGIVLYGTDGRRERCVYRRIFSGDKSPKYLQRYSKIPGQRRVQLRGIHGGQGSVLVLTEDWLSAKKVSMAGYDSWPLLRTSLAVDDLTWLTDQYDHVIVWLDNDSYIVNKNRDKIVSHLSLLVKVSSINDKSDPKDYTLAEIQSSIGGLI